MTKARDLSNLISTGVPNSLITLDANEIPNLAASKITSGTFADARIAASNVSQHATSFDDNKIVNDISTIALRQASNENKGAYNTNSMYVDVFQDDTGIASNTNAPRNNAEYVASATSALASNWSNYSLSSHTGGQFQHISSTDLFSATQPTNIGNLGSASALQSTGNNNNESHFIGLDRTAIGWGTGKRWQVLLACKNHDGSTCYPFCGISGGQGQTNSSNLPNRTSASSKFTYVATNTNQSQAGLQPATGTNGYHINFNLGYDNGVQGFHEDGSTTLYDASDNSIPTGNRIMTLLDYDGTAGTLTGQFNADNSATTVTKDLYYGGTEGSGNNLIQRSTTLPTSGFPYFYFGQHNGNTNSDNYYQLWYKETTNVINATGNFISNAITAPSSVSKMGAIVTYENAQGVNTLNTDIVLQLSADNGSNFTTATMTAMPDFATGIKMAKVNDLSVTAGTQLKYKISFANQSGSKEARIRGVSLQY